MATYIALANWTEQGARAVSDSPRRIDAARKTLEEMGGKFTSFLMTMGEYDIVLVYEAPDGAVAARFTLLLGRQGSVRTKTLKAFPEQAYRAIIESLD
jgi:uncharacterized protein with GYD domain